MSKFLVAILLTVGASNAHAVAPCAQVCPGPNEPCSLRCYLPNHFVTTCDQVYGGVCVPLAIDEEEEDDATGEDAVCFGEPELAPVVIAWVDAGIAFANRAVVALTGLS
jgi:hypothetical protein